MADNDLTVKSLICVIILSSSLLNILLLLYFSCRVNWLFCVFLTVKWGKAALANMSVGGVIITSLERLLKSFLAIFVFYI